MTFTTQTKTSHLSSLKLWYFSLQTISISLCPQAHRAHHIKESAWRPSHKRGKGTGKKKNPNELLFSSHHKTKFPHLMLKREKARKRNPTQHQLGQGAPRVQVFFYTLQLFPVSQILFTTASF